VRRPGSRVRWCVVASVFLLAFITIVDRVCISAAKQSMARELGITDLQFGWVFGAFTIGYAIFMVPSGWLADRYGPRVFLAAIVCAWSAFTMLTGLMQALVPLFLVRLLFGLAEAGAYPTASRALYNWMPASERGMALGLLNTGSRVGAAVGLAIATFIILSLGWRAAFFLLGAAGVSWAAFWLWWYRDDPARKPGVSEEELRHIRTGRSEAQTSGAPAERWTRIVFSRRGGLLLYQYFANNFTFFLVYSWFLPYLQQHFRLGAAQAGLFAGVPLYCGALGTWSGGVVVDRLYRRGLAARSRTLPGACGFTIAAASIVAAAHAPAVGLFVAAFGLAIFGVDFTVSPSWTVCSDLGQQNTGAVSGAMNMMGSVGSFAASITFPYLLQLTGRIQPYCYLAALFSVLAALSWMRLSSAGTAQP